MTPAPCAGRYTRSLLDRLPREAQADLVERLVDLVIRTAPESDDDDDDALPAGRLRAERDGFVLVWRKRPSRVSVLAEGGER